jgi:cell division protein FtsZ
MREELVKFQFSRTTSSIIKVCGVGGGGCNAVNHMYESGIQGVDYIVCNTDAQALAFSPVPVKIQLGGTLTEGRGAGNKPEMGEQAARENIEDLRDSLSENTKMLFITAGMGGGTGTGAAPVIAKLAQEMGILTIAVVTIPSPAEGKKRFNQAMEGISKLNDFTDSMLIVNNQRLQAIYGDLPARQAFKLADDIVKTAVKGVAEIITLHGSINIDFADVFTVMNKSKVFIMGTGFASGESRAMKAVKEALLSPLLDNNNIFGTRNILLNIISGSQEIRIGEIGEIIEYLQEEAGQEADIIWGNGYDENIGDEISVTILCTGFKSSPTIPEQKDKTREQFLLYEEATRVEFKPADKHLDEPQQRIFELELEPVAVEEEPPSIRKNQEKKDEKVITKRPPGKSKGEKNEIPKNENIDNWFYRNFIKLFEEDEQSV